MHTSRGMRIITYKSEFCFIFKKKLYREEKLKLDIQHVQLDKKKHLPTVTFLNRSSL